MKNILFLLIATFLFSSCAIQQTVSYEKTNASLIQKSIKNLNAVDNLKSKKINPWPLYVVPSVLLLLMLIF